MIYFAWRKDDIDQNCKEIYNVFARKRLLWLIPMLLLAVASTVCSYVFKIQVLDGLGLSLVIAAIFLTTRVLGYKRRVYQSLNEDFFSHNQNGIMEYTLDYCNDQYIYCNTTSLNSYRFVKQEIRQIKTTNRLIFIVLSNGSLFTMPNIEEVRKLFF